ncbi:MAG: tyrosinase [Streptomyces sp.]|nr:tyrosinase [Streptomyces sp.]
MIARQSTGHKRTRTDENGREESVVSESDAGTKATRRPPGTAVTRRRVIRSGAVSVVAVSGTAAALYPVLTSGHPPETRTDDADRAPGAHGGGAPQTRALLFDEIYKGRHIQGFTDPGEDGVAITIDGTPLPVMRRVDGTWISNANHYQPYTTPLATARGAVDVIGHARLSTALAHHH